MTVSKTISFPFLFNLMHGYNAIGISMVDHTITQNNVGNNARGCQTKNFNLTNANIKEKYKIKKRY